MNSQLPAKREDRGGQPGIWRSAKALKSTLAITFFGYATQALSLVALPLYILQMGNEGYGLIVTVMAFMGYIGFAEAGLGWGAMILIAHKHGLNDRPMIAHIVRHGAVLGLVSGLVALLAMGGVLWASEENHKLPMFAGHAHADRLVLLGALWVFANIQFAIVYNLLQGLQDGFLTGAYQGAGRLLSVVGGMLAAWFTHKPENVLLTQLLATVVSGTAASLHAYAKYPWAFRRGSIIDWAQYRAQISTGAKNFLLQIGRTVWSTAPTLAISSTLGAGWVICYTVPTTLLGMAFVPVVSWNASLQSAYGEAWSSGDRAWVINTFRQSLSKSLLFGGLGIALFLGSGDSFIRLWTSGRLQLDLSMAAGVSAVALITAVLGAGQYLLTGINRQKHAALAELANGLCGIALCFGIVSFGYWHLVGAGLAISTALTSGWVVWKELRRHLGGDCFPSGVFIAKWMLAVALGSLGAWFVVSISYDVFEKGAIVAMLTGVVTGAAVYFAVASVFRLIVPGDTWVLLNKVRRRLLLSIA